MDPPSRDPPRHKDVESPRRQHKKHPRTQNRPAAPALLPAFAPCPSPINPPDSSRQAYSRPLRRPAPYLQNLYAQPGKVATSANPTTPPESRDHTQEAPQVRLQLSDGEAPRHLRGARRAHRPHRRHPRLRPRRPQLRRVRPGSRAHPAHPPRPLRHRAHRPHQLRHHRPAGHRLLLLPARPSTPTPTAAAATPSPPRTSARTPASSPPPRS
jgi:hypothetical protein